MEKIEPLDCEFSDEMKELLEFQKLILDDINKMHGIPKRYLLPKTVVCPKCNEVHILTDGRDYVICCNEVTNFWNATYD